MPEPREAIRYAVPPELRSMDVHRHQAVEASAGTGKTFLIEHRIVDLLLHTEVSLEEILVVTFTEKATAELRGRVRRLLDRVARAAEHTAAPDQPHWTIDERARRRLRDALGVFERAPIYTIHAFCQRVLTENAFSNRRLFDQTQVASESAFGDAFRLALRQQLARDPDDLPYLRAWLAHAPGGADKVQALERLLFQCADKAGDAPIEPRFDSERWRAALVRAAATCLPYADLARGLELLAPHMNKVKGKACASRLAVIGQLVADFADGGDDALALGAFDAFRKKQKEPFPAYLRDSARDATALGALIEAITELHEAAAPLPAAIAQKFLPAVMVRLHLAKDRRGQFDFHDMLRLVWAALEGDGGAALAARLRQRYRFALIDEFQDTDELQWKIFRRLYLESTANRLSLIGDPKQAIYSFRGADVRTYLEARRELRATGGQLTSLTRNFRSTAAVVEAYNLLLSDELGGPFFDGGIRYDQPVTAAAELSVRRRADGAEVAPATLLDLDLGGAKRSIDEIRAALLDRVADEIHALVTDPARQLELVEPSGSRALGAGDIFVLTRSTAESADVADALRRRGVPCALYRQEGLFQSPQADEVLDLLAGIAEPRRRSTRFRAWQTRFFDVALADLPRLAELPETHPLVERLYSWKALADRLDYETLFSRILSESGVIERELLVHGSERGITNLQHLFELLLEDVLSSRCELHELVQRLQRWIDETEASPADDRDVQRLEADGGAVQVMTVHKSKGLEAPVVFLYGGIAGSTPRSEVNVYYDGDRRRIHVGAMPADVRARCESESRSEDQRLLYVALTRAAAQLYLPVVRGEAPSKAKASQQGSARAETDGGDAADEGTSLRGYYRALNLRLQEVLRRRAEEPRLIRSFDVVTVALAGAGGGAADDCDAVLAGWQPPPRLLAELPEADEALARLGRERAGFLVTSYTRLKEQVGRRVDADASGELAAEIAADVDAIAAAPEDDLPGGAAVGIFLHELLERVSLAPIAEAADFASWRARPEVEPWVRDAMLRHDQDERHLERVLALLWRALRSPLPAPGGVVLPAIAGRTVVREGEFLYPLPGPGERGFVKGFFDLAVEHDGRIYLLDWKSDILDDYSAAAVAAHARAHYEVQAELYALALERMIGAHSQEDLDGSFGGLLFCFLRGLPEPHGEAPASSGVVALRPSFAELRAYEAALGRRVGVIEPARRPRLPIVRELEGAEP